MTAVATHRGGPFYVWYQQTYGYAPPATVDSNASRYLAWQQGIPRGLAAAIPYGSFGPPGRYIPGAAVIAPVLVTTPTAPTPIVVPAATVLEQGVTVVAPFASPAPSGPAAGTSGAVAGPATFTGGMFEATAYGPPWDAINGTGVTATGVDLRDAPHRYIIAVDPNVIPLHSHVTITPNPFGDNSIVFAAEDTGGAIVGHHVDIYDWRGRASQLGWGVRQVTVKLVQDAATVPTTAGGAGYFNPLRHANVTPERIDQGVDYAGTGYLVAIADCVIAESVANGSGWEGEGYVSYKITQAGFLDGAYVYYAEGINPVVTANERVRGGSRLCDLRQPMPHGIEIGFASGDGESSYYAYHDGKYSEGDATRPGLAMSNLIHALGGPAGKIEGNVVGRFPEYMPSGEPPADLQAGTESAPLSGRANEQIPAATAARDFTFPGDYYSAFVQIQRGVTQGSHHSHAAQQYANGITYVTKAD